MRVRISQLRLGLDEADRPPEQIAAQALRLRPEEILSARLFRKSVDARDKRDVHFVLTIDAELRRAPAFLPRNAAVLKEDDVCAIPHADSAEDELRVPMRDETAPCGGANPARDDSADESAKPAPRHGRRPVVAGMGPAGLFAALRLARAGLCPLVLERGRDVDARTRDVERFWSGGGFDPASNVQFGEGGAGTFSDGKLNSGIKDPRCREVLETFRAMGAPEEILYSAKPHIGTDRLRQVVKNIRREILRLGGEVRFETALDDLCIEGGRLRAISAGGEWTDADALILAIGHSARDSFEMLLRAGVFMEQKPFSIGARIEHRQAMVDRAQYGAAVGHPALGAADYKLSVHLPDGRAAYTFCMCPGGQVIAAASEAGGVAVNGMSLYARDGENANSALLVSVGPGDYGGDDPLAGVRFQQKWERAAFALGGGDYRAPAQRVGDFLAGRPSSEAGDVRPSYRPGVEWTDLSRCLPDYVAADMRAAIVAFDRKLHGFAHPGAALTGVETRSSSPVRVLRDAKLHSPSARGLYPCGEGAGYAGGILSAAVDGLRCAEALIRWIQEER